MALPNFKYHPDPLKTGSIVESEAVCECCGEARGYIYTGPVYSEEELDDALCPWCIKSGFAHEKFGATFTDNSGIGFFDTSPASEEIIEEITQRTPGFSGWQQECWMTHCGDAAAFMGRAGKEELLAYGQEAIQAIQENTGLSDGEAWEGFFSVLDKNGSPTAYLFKCLKCGAFCGYQDCD